MELYLASSLRAAAQHRTQPSVSNPEKPRCSVDWPGIAQMIDWLKLLLSLLLFKHENTVQPGGLFLMWFSDDSRNKQTRTKQQKKDSSTNCSSINNTFYTTVGPETRLECAWIVSDRRFTCEFSNKILQNLAFITAWAFYTDKINL